MHVPRSVDPYNIPNFNLLHKNNQIDNKILKSPLSPVSCKSKSFERPKSSIVSSNIYSIEKTFSSPQKKPSDNLSQLQNSNNFLKKDGFNYSNMYKSGLNNNFRNSRNSLYCAQLNKINLSPNKTGITSTTTNLSLGIRLSLIHI